MASGSTAPHMQPEEMSSQVFEERAQIVENLSQELGTLLELSSLSRYKDCLIENDRPGAQQILLSIHAAVDRGIVSVRNAIADLRSPQNTPGTGTFRRREIARDLHDTILQNLTTLFFQVQVCQKMLAVSPSRARKEYPSLRNLFVDNIQGLKIFPFRHGRRETNDRLTTALKAYLKGFSTISAIKVRLRTQGKEPELPNEVKDNLFQIFKEALMNVKKHARAEKVEIRLSFELNRLMATVYDNGVGFAFITNDYTYFGISGMKERAQILGGRLSIEAAPGQGTCVFVDVPY